jgi:hypothetical protein
MLPSPSWQTFVGFFLAALGVAMGWFTGAFIITQITHAIIRTIYGTS